MRRSRRHLSLRVRGQSDGRERFAPVQEVRREGWGSGLNATHALPAFPLCLSLPAGNFLEVVRGFLCGGWGGYERRESAGEGVRSPLERLPEHGGGVYTLIYACYATEAGDQDGSSESAPSWWFADGTRPTVFIRGPRQADRVRERGSVITQRLKRSSEP
jgi:hypothetical protein